MTDTILLPSGSVVRLSAPLPPRLEAPAPAAAVVMPVPGIQGPRGPAGPPGPQGEPGEDGAFLGTAWWYGEGTPTTVIGSKAGDYYVDTTTGLVYELN